MLTLLSIFLGFLVLALLGSHLALLVKGLHLVACFVIACISWPLYTLFFFILSLIETSVRLIMKPFTRKEAKKV